MTWKLAFPALALFLLGPIPEATAQKYPYYENQKWVPATSPRGQRYYYSHYYYAPGRYHHAYYYPYKSQRYVYYYNWRGKRYWGRWDLETDKYSLLKPEKRKENLNDIRDEDFPPPQPPEKIDIPPSEEGEPPTGQKMTEPPHPPKDQ
jgi:hypothetical protein